MRVSHLPPNLPTNPATNLPRNPSSSTGIDGGSAPTPENAPIIMAMAGVTMDASDLERIDAALRAVCTHVDEIETTLAELGVGAKRASTAIHALLQALRNLSSEQGIAALGGVEMAVAGRTPASILQRCADVLRSALPFVDGGHPIRPLLGEIQGVIETKKATLASASEGHAGFVTAAQVPMSLLRRCIDALAKVAHFFDEALGLKGLCNDLKRGTDSMLLRTLGAMALMVAALVATLAVGTLGGPGAALVCGYILVMGIVVPLGGYMVFSGLENAIRRNGVAA